MTSISVITQANIIFQQITKYQICWRLAFMELNLYFLLGKFSGDAKTFFDKMLEDMFSF